MKYVIPLVVMLTMGSLSTAPVAGQASADHAQLIEVENKLADAVMRRDIKLLAKIYAHGFVSTDPYSGQLNKERWLGKLKSDRDKIESIAISDTAVNFFADTAIVTGRMTVRGRNPETDSNQKYQRLDWFTHTFIRQKGQWQLVASHASAIVSYGIRLE